MHRSYDEILKEHKLSLTSVRLSVLRAVEKHAHADVNAIYAYVTKEISTASKQAIYNNLHTLVEHGIVREINPTGSAALYEFECHDNHHHLICRSCEQIVDVDCKENRPCLSPESNHGFVIDEAEVTFWGLCPNCQNTTKGNQDE